MYVDVLLGLQWGDEGKGKIVDFLAPQYDIIARFQGGPNAGHTLYVNDKKFVLHTIPSGIFHKHLANIIGNGVVINPTTLLQEIKNLESVGLTIKDNLFISRRVSLILPLHMQLDAASEKSKGDDKIGSTLRGIGPVYMDKTGRNSIKYGDIFLSNFKERYLKLKSKHQELLKLYNYSEDNAAYEEEWFKAIDALKAYQVIDSEYYIDQALKSGKKVLAEGAQGTMLDVDFGTYPFVTSSNTISGGVCSGLGIAPQKIREVYGVIKAYCTRVGSGPFPSELHDETGEKIRKNGHEFGATTGRPRRCGWLDLPAVKYACMINGVTQLIVTKVDVLNDFEEIKIGESYQIGNNTTEQFPYIVDPTLQVNYQSHPGWNCALETKEFNQLPTPLQNYINTISEKTGVEVSIISTGVGRDDLVLRS
ncbi:MAG: adenylosuccinate synthase [Bacteroidetes bacterium]|nr:adenylosuccinate synthase [Bacteroidota bacterium]